MKALLTHFKIEFKSGLRDNTMLLMNYLFPLGFYILMGLLMPKLHDEFKTIMIPGMIAFSILASTILTIPNKIVSERESGIYRSYKVYGVTVFNILFLTLTTTIIHGLIVSIIIMTTAPIFFESVAVNNIYALLAISIAFMFTASSLSILIGICCKNTKVTTLWSQLLFIPSVILGGIMIPLEGIPKELITVSKIIPTTYATSAMRDLGMGQGEMLNTPISLIILVTLGIIALGLSYYLFQWDDKNRKKRNNLSLICILIPSIIAVFVL